MICSAASSGFLLGLLPAGILHLRLLKPMAKMVPGRMPSQSSCSESNPEPSRVAVSWSENGAFNQE